MPESPRKSSVQGILKSLKDDEPEEIFRHLLGRVNSELIPFFIVIDWKTSIDELHEWVRDALRENFGLTADFLKEAQEDDDLTVSDEAGFSAFDEKLRPFDLQFSLVDPGNDEYVFIIHPPTDLDTVRAAFVTLGLSYQSVSDLYS